MNSNLPLIRRYVADFVNRHDFSVITEIMTEDYTLETGGQRVRGRDDTYRSAVAKQFKQFPGLVFTLHEVMPAGDRIALRFTEHGASTKHAGRHAAWESIGIYKIRDGRLCGCAIEQDYFSRRRQLEEEDPMPVDTPATAPWDSPAHMAAPAVEAAVRAWLARGPTTRPGVQIDDQRATGRVDGLIAQTGMNITDLVTGGNRAAFHAVQHGTLAMDFGNGAAGAPAWMHCAGIVTVHNGEVSHGHVLRDRWGLYRRLSQPGATA
jgi:predicted ester cyclase